MISGIIPVLKSGGCRGDAPCETYAPGKTLSHRFVRRAAEGVGVDLFET